MTLEEANTLLDQGKLEMMRPQGDFVPVTRRGPSAKAVRARGGHIISIPVYMENEVEAAITKSVLKCGTVRVRT